MPPEREARTVDHRGLDDALAHVRSEAFQTAGRPGQPPLAAALAALGDNRPVFAAEQHDQYEDHLLQLAVLDGLRRDGRSLAVGVEWFQTDVQPHLDDYVAGRIDERTLLERADYFRRWRFDYRLYRPILRYARRHGIAVVALNAPPEDVQAVSEGGFDALPGAIRQRAGREPDDLPEDYVRRLRNVFDRHPGGSDFSHFVAVQLLWDETMAGTAADYQRRHPGRQLVIFAGRGHIIPAHTIPERFARETGRQPAVAAALAGDEETPATVDVASRPPALALPAPGRLGVRIGTGEDGDVVVESLQTDGAARAAGIPEGARLVRIGRRSIADPADVRLALYDRVPGDSVAVAYRPAAGEPVATKTVQLR